MTKQASRASTHSKTLEPLPFHERFKIQVGSGDAQRKFVNRVKNRIWENFIDNDFDYETVNNVILWQIANDLGEEFSVTEDFNFYIRDDFYRCLHALESIYEVVETKSQKRELAELIEFVLRESEIDLGITWQNGVFVRAGALELDEGLVNAPLQWLSDAKYSNVRKPFVKGLTAFLKSDAKPETRADVIRDMYEALEALAKVVTGRINRDLSANAETFIKIINASESYKRLIKEYITYANTFRHGLDSETERPDLSVREVESFIYLTGLFIRIAVKQP
jgi:hypothetical protein